MQILAEIVVKVVDLQFDGSFKSTFFGVANITAFEKADRNISFRGSLQNVISSFWKIGCFHIIAGMLKQQNHIITKKSFI